MYIYIGSIKNSSINIINNPNVLRAIYLVPNIENSFRLGWKNTACK